MASFVSNLIEYSGLADSLPANPTAFKQFAIQENLELPCAKPDIEQIIRVMAEVKITHTKVIRTPVGSSLEGQTLSGYKLIVEGEIIQKIEYVADEPTQSVHAAHFSVPFSTFIVLPPPPSFVIGTNVRVIPYIEDIYVKQIGKRKIFKNVIILLDAVF